MNNFYKNTLQEKCKKLKDYNAQNEYIHTLKFDTFFESLRKKYLNKNIAEKINADLQKITDTAHEIASSVENNLKSNKGITLDFLKNLLGFFLILRKYYDLSRSEHKEYKVVCQAYDTAKFLIQRLLTEASLTETELQQLKREIQQKRILDATEHEFGTACYVMESNTLYNDFKNEISSLEKHFNAQNPWYRMH